MKQAAVTVFSARLYGGRSRKNQKLIDAVRGAVEARLHDPRPQDRARHEQRAGDVLCPCLRCCALRLQLGAGRVEAPVRGGEG